MPEEGRAFDHALVDRKLWTLLIALNQLRPKGENATREVLLLSNLIIFFSAMTHSYRNAVIFFAEVAEVVHAHKFLGALGHQLHIEVLSEEKVIVLAKDATKARVERLRHNCMAQHANIWR